MSKQQMAEYRKLSQGTLRVYSSNADKTGRILCRDHRDSYYVLNPAARGMGEWGGQCEPCAADA